MFDQSGVCIKNVMGNFFIIGRKPFIMLISKKLYILFQVSSKSSFRLSGFICRKLLQRLVLPVFGHKIKQELINTAVQTRFKAIDDLLLQLLEGDGKKFNVEELFKGMAGATSYWQLLQYPIEILTVNLVKIIGADEKFAITVGKLSSIFASAGTGLAMEGTSGLLMSILFCIVAGFVAWFITKLFAPTIDKLKTDKLLCGFTVKMTDMLVSVMNYIYACKISADKWVTLMKEKSENFLSANKKLAEKLLKQYASRSRMHRRRGLYFKLNYRYPNS